MTIAAALGIDFKTKESDPVYGSIEPQGGMSIAEMAAKIKPPKAGGSTLEASQEVMRLMRPEGSA
jgi:hypothetical protein